MKGGDKPRPYGRGSKGPGGGESRTQRAPAANLFAKAARDEYLEEHAERMRRIRRAALAAIEREERAGGVGRE